GTLPWRQSADLKRFKELTMGHHLIMGRKTFASLGRVLPGRTSIVLTRQVQLDLPPGVHAVSSLDAALALASGDAEPFVIGGGEVFQIALPHVTRLYLTRIEADIDGDTFFPEMDLSAWRLVGEASHPADAKNQYPYTFQTW